MNLETEYKINNLPPLEKSLVYLLKIGGHSEAIKVLILSSFLGDKPEGNFCFRNNDDENKSILHYAIENYSPDLFPFLFEHFPAEAYELENNFGENALLIAVTNHLSIATDLIEKTSKLVNQTNGKSIFSYAAESGNQVFLEKILSTTSKDDLKLFYNSTFFFDHEGNTPVHYAAIAGHHEVIKLFAKYNFPFTINNSGETPLISACKNKQLEAVKCLLQLKENPDISDFQGDTPLHYAWRDDNTAMIRLLNSWHADHSIQNKKGQSVPAIRNDQKITTNLTVNEEKEPIEQPLEPSPQPSAASGRGSDLVVIYSRDDSGVNELEPNSNLGRRETYLRAIDYLQDQVLVLQNQLAKYQGTRILWRLGHSLGALLILSVPIWFAIFKASEKALELQSDSPRDVMFVINCIWNEYPTSSADNYSKVILYLKTLSSLLLCKESSEMIYKADSCAATVSCDDIIRDSLSFLNTLAKNPLTFKVTFIISLVMVVLHLVFLIWNWTINTGPYSYVTKNRQNLPAASIKEDEQYLLALLKNYLVKVIADQSDLNISLRSPNWQTLLNELNNAQVIADLNNAIDNMITHFQNEKPLVHRHTIEGNIISYYNNPAVFFRNSNPIETNNNSETVALLDEEADGIEMISLEKGQVHS